MDKSVDPVEPLTGGLATVHMSQETLLEKALIEKEKGNAYFKKQLYKKALNCYTKSISLDEGTGLVYGNRAITWIKLGCFEEAEKDCNAALDLDPKNIKALWRRGIARKEMKRYKLAKADLEYALILEPSNSQIKRELEEVKSFCKDTKTETTQVLPSIQKEMKQRPVRKRIIIEEFGECANESHNEEKQIEKISTDSVKPVLETKELETKEISKQAVDDFLQVAQEIKSEKRKHSFVPPSNFLELDRVFKSLKGDSLAMFDYVQVRIDKAKKR